jgi:hypothetical protein
MVWHDNEFVQDDIFSYVISFLPFLPDDLAELVYLHLTFHHLTEQAFPLKGADRHEIRPGAAIIVIPQTYGTPMVNVRVVSHGKARIAWYKARNDIFQPKSATYA